MNETHQPGDEAAVRYALYRSADETAQRNELDLIVNSVIEIDGDHARASSVRVRLGGTDRAPQLLACDRLIDELTRRPGGGWQLERRAIAGHTSMETSQ